MCGRMTLARGDLDEVADEIAATYDPALREAYKPRYNIAPTDRHLIVRAAGDERHLQAAGWGFRRQNRPPLFNARAETAATRPPFRDAYAQGRCVVPIDGFYEWSGPPDARQPYWIHGRDGRLLLLAGLYEPNYTAGGAPLSFTVLTTTPNPVIAQLHDRMPVILAPGDVQEWLRNGSDALLRAAPAGALELTPVSTRVNSVKNDDPACLEPVTLAPGARGQLPLF